MYCATLFEETRDKTIETEVYDVLNGIIQDIEKE